MLANSRVMEAISRLTGLPVDELRENARPVPRLHEYGPDQLDRVELVMEVLEEFDEETVRLALRYIELLEDSGASAIPSPRR